MSKGNPGESEMFRNVLDALPQCISWKNLKQEYLGCNTNFARMVGLDDPASIAGKTDADLPRKIADDGMALNLPLHDAEGKVVGLVASLSETQSETEHLYKAILKASPDCIVITTLDAKILNVSYSSVKMFGRAEEEVLGQSIMNFVVTQDHERAMSRVTLMFQGIMTGPGEYRGIHRNGKVFPIEVNAELIRDAEVKPTRILFIIRDIS
jgi:PAS domain S-box-containing protein